MQTLSTRGRKLQSTPGKSKIIRLYRGYVRELYGDDMAMIFIEEYLPEQYRVREDGYLEVIHVGGMFDMDFEIPVEEIYNPKSIKIVPGTYVEARVMVAEGDGDDSKELIVEAIDSGKVTKEDIEAGKEWAKKIMKTFGVQQ